MVIWCFPWAKVLLFPLTVSLFFLRSRINHVSHILISREATWSISLKYSLFQDCLPHLHMFLFFIWLLVFLLSWHLIFLQTIKSKGAIAAHFLSTLRHSGQVVCDWLQHNAPRDGEIGRPGAVYLRSFRKCKVHFLNA